MRVDAFDFDLPEAAIALRPARPRDAGRLLEVDPARNAPLADHVFRDLAGLLRANDILVFNDTKVIPAQLEATRHRGEARARVGLTLHKRIDTSTWAAFARPARKLMPGDRLQLGGDGNICFAGNLNATVTARDGAEVVLAFDFADATLDAAIAELGVMPLPPYIASKRAVDEADRTDYQTIFAAREGAVAAPTAALHFTDEVMAALDAAGIASARVTLHVGAGTFLPVSAEDTGQHKMHAEWGEVPDAAVAALKAAREKGGRIVAVGTTCLRLLEASAAESGDISVFSGDTDIFITPGHRFRSADLLLTNFHLPRSTLFMLVCAFSGLDLMKKAYRHGIESGYRFYSYGDACLLHRAPTR